MHKQINIHIYTKIHTHTHTLKHTHTHTHMHQQMNIHTYIHKYTHTLSHTSPMHIHKRLYYRIGCSGGPYKYESENRCWSGWSHILKLTVAHTANPFSQLRIFNERRARGDNLRNNLKIITGVSRTRLKPPRMQRSLITSDPTAQLCNRNQKVSRWIFASQPTPWEFSWLIHYFVSFLKKTISLIFSNFFFIFTFFLVYPNILLLFIQQKEIFFYLVLGWMYGMSTLIGIFFAEVKLLPNDSVTDQKKSISKTIVIGTRDVHARGLRIFDKLPFVIGRMKRNNMYFKVSDFLIRWV